MEKMEYVKSVMAGSVDLRVAVKLLYILKRIGQSEDDVLNEVSLRLDDDGEWSMFVDGSLVGGYNEDIDSVVEEAWGRLFEGAPPDPLKDTRIGATVAAIERFLQSGRPYKFDGLQYHSAKENGENVTANTIAVLAKRAFGEE